MCNLTTLTFLTSRNRDCLAESGFRTRLTNRVICRCDLKSFYIFLLFHLLLCSENWTFWKSSIPYTNFMQKFLPELKWGILAEKLISIYSAENQDVFMQARVKVSRQPKSLSNLIPDDIVMEKIMFKNVNIKSIIFASRNVSLRFYHMILQQFRQIKGDIVPRISAHNAFVQFGKMNYSRNIIHR